MPALRKLMEGGREMDTPLLVAACDRLLEAARTRDALEVWHALAAGHRVTFAALAPDRGTVVTNGRFVIAPTSHGFDWHLPGVEGVSAAREDQSGGLRLTFSGGQPESCDVLAQSVPVLGDKGYRLAFRYRTGEMAEGAGLVWRVLDESGRELAVSESLHANEEREAELLFRTGPATCPAVRLVLAYRRPSGITRTAGYIVLKQVDVVPTAQLNSDQPLRSRVRK
jgi:hypothetical protein